MSLLEDIQAAIACVDEQSYEVCRHSVHPSHLDRLLPWDRADEAVTVVPCANLCGHSFLLGPAT